MIVDSGLGLGVHVTQKFGISRINMTGVNDPRKDVEGERHVHGFADIIFIPTSPARAATMSTGEGEGQAAYVDALAPDWPGFIHEC